MDALKDDASVTSPTTPGETLAEGAKIGDPARGAMMLDAARDSAGDAVAVTEPELVEALRLLWQQGVYAEPTAALGAAAFLSKVRNGWAVPDGPVVILITGSGLKATDAISTLLSD